MFHATSTQAKRACITIAAMMLLSTFAMASGDAWMTDYDAGLAKAKAENKDLLVDFSGSDWCGWCIKLDNEVFNQEEFQTEAGKQFVLVVLDFPSKPENKAKIPEALQKRNEELKTEFGIRGFPSVLLIGSDGKPYARTGYQAGGVAPYLEHLSTFRADKTARTAIQAKLANTEGLARAKLLDELIEATQEDLRDSMIEEMKEIVTLDPENNAGLKSKYDLKTQLLEVKKAKDAKEFDKAEKMYQDVIDNLKPEGEQLQNLYFQWGEIKFHQNDNPGIVECLQNALAAAPDSKMAPQLKMMIQRFQPKEEASENKAETQAEAPAKE